MQKGQRQVGDEEDGLASSEWWMRDDDCEDIYSGVGIFFESVNVYLVSSTISLRSKRIPTHPFNNAAEGDTRAKDETEEWPQYGPCQEYDGERHVARYIRRAYPSKCRITWAIPAIVIENRYAQWEFSISRSYYDISKLSAQRGKKTCPKRAPMTRRYF